MLRSEINQIIEDRLKFLKSLGYSLPKEANWDLKKWYDYWDKETDNTKQRRERRIGWDLTDLGLGDFERYGLLLYTLTNGIIRHGIILDQPYSKKYLIVGDGQITPDHYHDSKMEDIVNIGGGDLEIKVKDPYDEDGVIDYVKIFHNSEWIKYKSGSIITLKKNDRIRLESDHSHEFCGKGMVLVEENSSVNDDEHDNFFSDTKVKRFQEIDEDEEPRYLLWKDLPCREKDPEKEDTMRFDRLVEQWL